GGRVMLHTAGTMDDVAWINLGKSGAFDISQRTSLAYTTDAVISGTGRIGGSGTILTVGSGVGAVSSAGVLKPGETAKPDTAASSSNVGNQTGKLSIDGSLVLAASGGPRVDRAVLQVGATNRNASSSFAGDIAAWVDSIPTNHAAFMTGAGSNHDLVEVEGSL